MVDSAHQLPAVLSSEIVIVSALKTEKVALLLVGHAKHEASQILIGMFTPNFLFNDDASFVDTTVEDDKALVLSFANSRSFLSNLGIEGEIISTPSHSEDSICVMLDEGICLAGDLEPYEYLAAYTDNATLKADWDKVLSYSPKRICYAHANEKIISELLPVLDNFERALDTKSDDMEGYVKGMELIFTQLRTALEHAGLEEIPAMGEEFDPNVHNAVMTEDSDEHDDGKISKVLQKGYKLNDKVIRPSMVAVVRK